MSTTIGRLEAIKDGPGAVLYHFPCNADGQIEQLTDPQQRTWVQRYDNLGRITEVVAPAPPDHQSQRFEYCWLSSPTRLRVTVTHRRGNMLALTDPLGHTWRWTYDQCNNVRTITPPLEAAGNSDPAKQIQLSYEDFYQGQLADPRHLKRDVEPADGQGNPAATTTLTWHHTMTPGR